MAPIRFHNNAEEISYAYNELKLIGLRSLSIIYTSALPEVVIISWASIASKKIFVDKFAN